MLYTFTNLANRLTELGYPEASEQGFRIIRRDLTLEEQAGNLQYNEDGIYLTIDGQSYKGYMYLKYADITRYGYPKFHITNCQVVLGQRASGRFDGRYFWHNSNTVSVEDRATGIEHENITLGLCGYCRGQSNITEYNDTEGFFNLLDLQEQDDLNQEFEVDIFGYTRDWQRISREYKKEKEYTCERCTMKIETPSDKRFIHVHHRNGDKLNNRRTNLECLCILCHSHTDATHIHNFERRRLQADINSFVSKYRDALEQCGNQLVNQY